MEKVIRPLEGDRLERPGMGITGNGRGHGFEVQEVEGIFDLLQLFGQLLGR